MRPLLLSVALLSPPIAIAEANDDTSAPDVVYPVLPAQAAAIEAFVPEGWRVEADLRGQLDADDLPDALLLLRMADPANVLDNAGFGVERFDTNPRMLVALLAQPGGGWQRVLQDHVLVPRPDSPVQDDYLGDAPADALRIHPDRTWSINLHSWTGAGSWYISETTYTFRLELGCMRLIGLDDTTTHRGSGETSQQSINYLTGKAWRQDGSIDDDTPGPQRWTRLESKARVCIGDIGEGFGYVPALVPWPESAP